MKLILQHLRKGISYVPFISLLIISGFVSAQSSPSILMLDWSPDGTKIAGAGNHLLRIWDATTGSILIDFSTMSDTYVHDISWSPDSKKLVSASDDQMVRIWNVADPNYTPGQLLDSFQPFTELFSLLRSVDWKPDGQLIATGALSQDFSFRTWNANTYNLENEFAFDFIGRLAWKPNVSSSDIIIGIEDGGASIVRIESPPLNLTRDIGGRQAVTTAISWSPDGNRTALGYDDGSVYVWDATTNTQIASMQTGIDYPIHELAWSPNGNLIASANGSIKVWNSLSGQLIQTVSNTSLAVDFSPDGHKIVYGNGSDNIQIVPSPTNIVFATNRDGNFEIYTMNADGSSPTRLTNNAAWDTQPAWSPDRSKIAFATDRNGNFEIYTMDANGSNLARLTTNTVDIAPSWSPDGSKIVFVSARDGNFEVYTMGANGSNPTRLTNNAASDTEPHWSPDGTTIAFTTDRDGNLNIYTMNTSGGSLTQLTTNSAADYGSVWSPDGAKLAFATNRDGNFEVYAMDANGSNPTNLTSNSADDGFYFVPPNVVHFGITWSVDGTQIMFISLRDSTIEIYRMNANGSSPARVTTNSDIDVSPDW